LALTPVLVLRALGLGDTLTGVPALRALRRHYSGRALVLAGPFAVSDWLRRQGLVDAVLPVGGLAGVPPGRVLGRHVAVNLHGRGPQSHRLLMAGQPDDLVAFDCPAAGFSGPAAWRPDEHEVRRWCRLVAACGAPCDPEDLRLPPPPGRTSAGQVVIHPGAADRARRWPADRWAAVARELGRSGARVVLTGSMAERGLCRSITVAADVPCADLSGTLTLDDLAAVIASAGLVLSGDTGVAHLATAYGVPSVTLFGPTPPSYWGPLIDPDLHTVLYAGTSAGDPHADRPDPALLRITVEDVLSAMSARYPR